MSNSKKVPKQPTQNPNEEERYRIYGILAYFFILVILGLPIWWYTTRVYRASLPYSDIENLKLKKLYEKNHGIPPSLEYDVLISFVHPDPAGLNVDVRGEDVETILMPFFEKMSGIATFVFKSQWIFSTEIEKNTQNQNLLEKYLPHLITPLETKIWSNISPRPTVNLVIYITRCNKQLNIVENEGNNILETNAFLSQRWGGILIVNPDEASCSNGTFKPHLNLIKSTLIAQLKSLFNLDKLADIDLLKINKTNEMLDSTKRTLKSLSQLLSEISSIVISDEVGDKIKLALDYVNLAESTEDVNEGLSYAKMAFFYSEAAFSDPSLLALLYFPEDQKYAVYIPLFLPIMIPVFMSLKVVRNWWKQDKVKSE